MTSQSQLWREAAARRKKLGQSATSLLFQHEAVKIEQAEQVEKESFGGRVAEQAVVAE